MGDMEYAAGYGSVSAMARVQHQYAREAERASRERKANARERALAAVLPAFGTDVDGAIEAARKVAAFLEEG